VIVKFFYGGKREGHCPWLPKWPLPNWWTDCVDPIAVDLKQGESGERGVCCFVVGGRQDSVPHTTHPFSRFDKHKKTWTKQASTTKEQQNIQNTKKENDKDRQTSTQKKRKSTTTTNQP